MNCLLAYDLLFLLETKCAYFQVPGFTVISSCLSPNRGGCAALIKNCLAAEVVSCDSSYDGQVWLQLRAMPNIWIAGVYVPPSDSPYFSPTHIANIQAKCLQRPDCKFMILGDINSRFSNSLQGLLKDQGLDNLFKYQEPVDSIQRPNTNATAFLQLCKDCSLLPLNGLQNGNMRLNRALTYRQKSRGWVSELDWCLFSADVANSDCVVDFQINQDVTLPSNHAPIQVVIAHRVQQSVQKLFERTSDLFNSNEQGYTSSTRSRNRPIQKVDVDNDLFRATVEQFIPAVDLSNIDQVITEACHNLISVSNSCQRNDANENIPEARERWQKILDSNNSRLLWKAINWNGEYTDKPPKAEEKPTDEEFKNYFENLLSENQEESLVQTQEIYNEVYIPILDNNITMEEVNKVIQTQLKSNKASGPDNVTPALLQMLPVSWLIFLTHIFNVVFQTEYPESWRTSRLTTIFKKGDRLNCDNYRGISVMGTLAKTYDYILHNRLSTWFQPQKEQAGAQPHRSCTDHLLTLRLFINYAVEKKQKLFVLMVDFSKAYDKIPRNSLLAMLRKHGIGSQMLHAIESMYKRSWNSIGTSVAESKAGVRQGAPTSCFLFTFYVNELVKMLRNSGNDSYLGWVHSVMLMDDTAIMASSRKKLLEKLAVLETFCTSYGMQLNQSKTKFMVFGGDNNDKQPLLTNHTTILNCEEYCYLGMYFTQDGKTSTSVKRQATDKQKHVLKLSQFLHKNKDFPFCAKRHVLEAAFNAALLYGAETWIDCDVSKMTTLYLKAIKTTLGVRETTPNDICLLEIGLPALCARMKEMQYNYFKKIQKTRHDAEDDPLIYALAINREANTKIHRAMDKIARSNESFVKLDMANRRTKIENSIRSKEVAYRSVNPTLDTHPLYTTPHTIAEHTRLCFTRLRCISHKLAVETGRWSRTPREERLCSCGQVQTEIHVLLQCPQVHFIKQKHNATDITNMTELLAIENYLVYIEEVMNHFA